MELPAKGIVIHKHPFHRQSSEGDKSQGSQIRHIRQDLVLKYINEKGYVLCIEKRPLKLKLDVNYPTNWRMLVFIFKNCSKFHNKNDYWHFANVCDIIMGWPRNVDLLLQSFSSLPSSQSVTSSQRYENGTHLAPSKHLNSSELQVPSKMKFVFIKKEMFPLIRDNISVIYKTIKKY